jgi:hypothetical protein
MNLKAVVGKIIKDQKAKEKEHLQENSPIHIDVSTKQYKALVSRLQKYDNPKTDAIRMALHYLEEKGNMKIDALEKFIQ